MCVLVQVLAYGSSVTTVDSGLLFPLSPAQSTISCFLLAPSSDSVAGIGVILPYTSTGIYQLILLSSVVNLLHLYKHQFHCNGVNISLLHSHSFIYLSWGSWSQSQVSRGGVILDKSPIRRRANTEMNNCSHSYSHIWAIWSSYLISAVCLWTVRINQST